MKPSRTPRFDTRPTRRRGGATLLAALAALGAFISPGPRGHAEPPVDAAQRQLAAFRNTKRVLLVFASGERDARYQTQQRLWAKQETGFAERDLVQLPVFSPAGGQATPFATRHHVRPGAFAVILIGKDGNPAFRSGQPVPAGEIFERIDAMPMRREEMRRQRGG